MYANASRSTSHFQKVSFCFFCHLGTQGIVYKATDLLTGQRVAIKEYKDEGCEQVRLALKVQKSDRFQS